MSKIKTIANNEDSILVFDIDGVLAFLEFGEYNHYSMNDEKFNIENEKGVNFYTEDKVIKRMQKYLKNKNKENIYVVSTIGSENEGKFKKEFVKKYYNIKDDNIFFTKNDDLKLDMLNKIRDITNKKENNIIMIDDSVNVLNNIMDNSNYLTMHISSFLDL